MELSPLAKHINDKDTFKVLEKYVNTHNKLNEFNVKIDEKEIDKQINAEIDKVISKYFKKR